jgi:hypothetical protein
LEGGPEPEGGFRFGGIGDGLYIKNDWGNTMRMRRRNKIKKEDEDKDVNKLATISPDRTKYPRVPDWTLMSSRPKYSARITRDSRATHVFPIVIVRVSST